MYVIANSAVDFPLSKISQTDSSFLVLMPRFVISAQCTDCHHILTSVPNIGKGTFLHQPLLLLCVPTLNKLCTEPRISVFSVSEGYLQRHTASVQRRRPLFPYWTTRVTYPYRNSVINVRYLSSVSELWADKIKQ